MEKKCFEFAQLPLQPQELWAEPWADRRDPFAVAALTVAALAVYTKDRPKALGLLNDLKGPKPLNPFDIQFIRDRFMDGRDYVPFSYFRGAVPGNNYTPEQPLTVEIEEQAHSRDQEAEGYLKLFLRSGGADSPRYVVLRCKNSTGEWFTWEYEGLLAGIRVPKADDPWA